MVSLTLIFLKWDIMLHIIILEYLYLLHHIFMDITKIEQHSEQYYIKLIKWIIDQQKEAKWINWDCSRPIRSICFSLGLHNAALHTFYGIEQDKWS